MHEPLRGARPPEQTGWTISITSSSSDHLLPWQLVAAGYGYDQAEQVRELLRRQGFFAHTGAATWLTSSAVPEVGNGQHDEQS
jgi:hypothetical protein